MSKLRDHLVILCNGAFWSGKEWKSEYVDAQKFSTRTAAKSHALRLYLDDKTKKVRVIEQYKTEDEKIIATYG